MALERMVVTNHERWGNLVKTWSTGHNYLEDDNEYPVPETVSNVEEAFVSVRLPLNISSSERR